MIDYLFVVACLIAVFITIPIAVMLHFAWRYMLRDDDDRDI
jgi:hypothetical protein